eukprot:TRINITY_DN16424_c0_g1::TRINITY_DN16424_c0_g1_i1::g.29516::m.29516 TRINITY_DN16424_c0_g1::TRINITY_DN16424_c0_g1_i1::g.29516  ORF type:complete len:362 (+),score=-1.28,sp/A7STV9/SLX1_NEMVE/45.03/2e-31,GIY-YIG/PF01541.19/2.7e-09,zf-HC5HC2H_2/PF13832.1/6.5e+03,zf-HC5HC2H_2/PF13832.1/0.00086,zf-HC5HC2H/PF13771.1/0.0058 TRINITY_DN16424_c0_g1_i1:45-1088(+)
MTFFACYLLKSADPQFQNHEYIGFTNNPLRRIRQHNGELKSGAMRTKQKRPWVMEVVVFGFPTKQAALQFEWAWQHPTSSRHLKKFFPTGKNTNRFRGKLRVLHQMLAIRPWNSLDLHLHLTRQEVRKLIAKCTPPLASAPHITIGPLEDLLPLIGNNVPDDEDDNDDQVCHHDNISDHSVVDLTQPLPGPYASIHANANLQRHSHPATGQARVNLSQALQSSSSTVQSLQSSSLSSVASMSLPTSSRVSPSNRACFICTTTFPASGKYVRCTSSECTMCAHVVCLAKCSPSPPHSNLRLANSIYANVTSHPHSHSHPQTHIQTNSSIPPHIQNHCAVPYQKAIEIA